MSGAHETRRGGWSHQPANAVTLPLDRVLPLPLPDAPRAGSAPELHLVFTEDGLYAPAVVRRPAGAGPFATVVVIHPYSGGLGIDYMLDRAMNEAWVIEALIARGWAVCYAEGRAENEDAYGTSYSGSLDHHDMVAVLRYLAGQPWADATRIAVLGVSHGGEMQMKVAAEIGSGSPRPAALVMCEPAVIEFLGLEYEGVRKESNLQFRAPVADSQIDLAASLRRLEAIPRGVPMLVVGRDDDHLQGLFRKLVELGERAGHAIEWATFPHPEHAYQLGPRRTAAGYALDRIEVATLDCMLAFLDRHIGRAPA